MAILGTIVLSAEGSQASPSGFSDALETAFYVGAVVMAVGFVLAHLLMPAGKQAEIERAPAVGRVPPFDGDERRWSWRSGRRS